MTALIRRPAPAPTFAGTRLLSSLPGSGARARRAPSSVVGLAAAAGLTVVLVAAVVFLRQGPGRFPGDASPEAGFARDMSVHHAQAVEMAELVRERTRDPEVRLLATDIALTQQAQIGRMAGWLEVWGLSPTGREPPMAWAGHAVNVPMPGMATPEELGRLREATPEEADGVFLRLMIRHHQGGVEMARAALARRLRPEVERLATAIAQGQQAEVAAMEDLLRRQGSAVSVAGAPLASAAPAGHYTERSETVRAAVTHGSLS